MKKYCSVCKEYVSCKIILDKDNWNVSIRTDRIAQEETERIRMG